MVELVAISEVSAVNPRLDAALSPDEQVSFAGMADMSDVRGALLTHSLRLYSEVAKGYTPFRQNDVLIAKITPCFENGKIGRATISTDFGFGSTEFHVVRPDPNRLDSGYFRHFVRRPRFRQAGEMRMTGSAGQRRVPASFVSDALIPLPALDEQRRIAAILDKADDLRAKHREALAHLDTLTQSIFHNMFGASTREDSDWQRCTVGDIARITTGRTPPGRLGTEAYGDELPFVTPGDLEKETVKRYLSGLGAKHVPSVSAGSLLVCCIGATIGKMGVAKARSSFNQQINAVEWADSVDPYFGFYSFQQLKPLIRTAGSSTTLPILNKSSFTALPFAIAPMNLQRRFAERIAAVERLKDHQSAQLAELDALFASLQHRAFKGEL